MDFLLSLLFVTLIFGLAIICWTVVKLVSAATAHTTNIDETRLLQEIHRGLERMEERVEALETLLFDREAGGRH